MCNPYIILTVSSPKRRICSPWNSRSQQMLSEKSCRCVRFIRIHLGASPWHKDVLPASNTLLRRNKKDFEQITRTFDKTFESAPAITRAFKALAIPTQHDTSRLCNHGPKDPSKRLWHSTKVNNKGRSPCHPTTRPFYHRGLLGKTIELRISCSTHRKGGNQALRSKERDIRENVRRDNHRR